MAKLLTIITVLTCFFLSIVFWGWLSVFSPSITFFCLLSLIVFSVVNVFVWILFNRVLFFLKIAVISLSFLCFALLSLFVFGFLCVIVSQNNFVGYSESLQFPLGDARGIAVDPNGLVYCGSKFYNRLQAYDADGKFLKGWFVPFPKGAIYIKITDEQNLQIFNSDGVLHSAYDANGKPLKFTKYNFTFTPELQYETQKTSVGRYKIIDRYFITKIIKTTSDNNIVVVKDSIYQTILKGPLPLLPVAILVFLFNVLVIFNIQQGKLNTPCSNVQAVNKPIDVQTK